MATIPDRLVDELDYESRARIALEATVIEGYRLERLSQGEVGELLGLSFSQVEQFLRERGVTLHYDLEDLEADQRANLRLLSK